MRVLLSNLLFYTIVCGCINENRSMHRVSYQTSKGKLDTNMDFWIDRIEKSKFITKEKIKLGITSISYQTTKEIDKNNNLYYRIRVGQNLKYRFVVLYNFHVYPKDSIIKIYNPFTDSLSFFD